MMFKWIATVLGVAAGLVLGVLALQFAASETGEVVVLHTRDGEALVTTRLWVVEDGGRLWLRSGGAASGWYARIVEAPQVELERAGTLRSYVAHPVPEARNRIHALMRQKYGWRDRVVEVTVPGRSGSIPVRLDPAERVTPGA
jgi:hypothetical protein